MLCVCVRVCDTCAESELREARRLLDGERDVVTALKAQVSYTHTHAHTHTNHQLFLDLASCMLLTVAISVH